MMIYNITQGKSLNPRNDFTGKSNYRIFKLIAKNGDITERILLNVENDSLREIIVFTHFLQNYFNCFAKGSAVTDVIARDDPWDFHIKIDDIEDLIVEITAMADNPQLFEKFKNEERLLSSVKNQKITVRELKRLEFAFPDLEIKSLIEKFISEGKRKGDLVENPYFGNDSFIFLSSQSPYVPDFHKNLQITIDKKLKKNHPNKSEVTLIIDNRTILFDLETVDEKICEIATYISSLPFKEVWLYTGYYSDNDGSNSEYTLIPLKIPEDKIEILRGMIL